MAAPQTIKDAVIAALDNAYDTDGTMAIRVTLETNEEDVEVYGDRPDVIPATVEYKVFTDAQRDDQITVVIKIRPPAPYIWPK